MDNRDEASGSPAYCDGIFIHPFTVKCTKEGCTPLLEVFGPKYYCEKHKPANAKRVLEDRRTSQRPMKCPMKKICVSFGKRDMPAQEVNLPVQFRRAAAAAVRKKTKCKTIIPKMINEEVVL